VTNVIEKIPPSPKQRTPVPISVSPRKRTRSERSTAIESLTTPSVVALVEPPIAATTVPSPTITAGRLSQKRKRSFKGKCWKDIDPIILVENQTPSASMPKNSIEIRILGFTLCLELQATILSIQTECTPIVAESSALPKDFVHHTSSNDV
jgi:hypothetical protein